VFAALSDHGELKTTRIEHDRRDLLRAYLGQFEPGTPVAVETMTSWYWLVDEIEGAGLTPKLANAYKAKVMMGNVNKHDKLDAEGLATLLRTGTLPAVWIPPAELRDQRELLRWRMELVRHKVRIKNRVHAVLQKYAIDLDETSDVFNKKGRQLLWGAVEALPVHTRCCLKDEMKLLEDLEIYQWQTEKRLADVLEPRPEVTLLQTMPGIGPILSAVIWFEIGDIGRFTSAERLASYAGVVPRVHASGGKVRHGGTRNDVNHYLKCAYVEAANVIARWRHRHSERHTVNLYERIRAKKGHGKAAVAVARHLAEASYWILVKKEKYKDPSLSVHARQSAPGV
jgi:transposase